MTRISWGRCIGTLLAYFCASAAIAQTTDPFAPLWGNNSSGQIRLVHDEDGHDHQHNGAQDHDHDHHHHDTIEPYDPSHEHTTSAGTPIFEALRTDHAFLERKVRFDYLSIRGTDREADRVADLDALNTELFWQLNSRMAVVVTVPYIHRNERLFPGADPDDPVLEGKGFGDLEAGFRFLAFNGEMDLVTFGLNVTVPTGADSRGLSEGHTSVEPVALWWHDVGNATVLQTQLALEVPVGTHESESEFIYNVALMHTLQGTRCWSMFRWLTPLIEVNGRTLVNGEFPGRTVVELTPGVRWAISEKDHAGLGVSFPVSGTREFDSLFIFSFIHHF